MSKPGVVRFLYTQNPFYLIGTAILLYGLRIATDSGSYFADQPYLLPIVLGAVMIAMTLTAITIIRFGGVWDDARTIVLSILLLAVSAVTGCDAVIRSQPLTSAAILLGGFLLSVGIWETLVRSLKVTFPMVLRLPFYFILFLIFFYSLLFSPADNWSLLSQFSAAGKLYTFGWLVALGILMCLPAIRASRTIFRNNGTPWSWPAYPWSIFVVLVGVACLRLYFMSLAFIPEYGWDNPIGLHFYVPVIFATAVLIFEGWQVESKTSSLGVTGFATFGAVMLLMSLPISANQTYMQFFELLTRSIASPFWITLMLLFVYAGVFLLRGKTKMRLVISSLLLIAAFTGPDQTTTTDSVYSFWPLIGLVGLQNYWAFRASTIKQWATAAVATSVAVGISLSPFNLPLACFAGSQILMAYCLWIGLAFSGLQAVWLRLAAVGLMLTCSTVVTVAAFAEFAAGWQAASYIALLQGLTLILWGSFRWPLLARIPLLLTPLLLLALAADYSSDLQQFLSLQANLFIVIAVGCFVVGFLISSYKAGWLKSLTGDFNNLVKSIQLELKT